MANRYCHLLALFCFIPTVFLQYPVNNQQAAQAAVERGPLGFPLSLQAAPKANVCPPLLGAPSCKPAVKCAPFFMERFFTPVWCETSLATWGTCCPDSTDEDETTVSRFPEVSKSVGFPISLSPGELHGITERGSRILGDLQKMEGQGYFNTPPTPNGHMSAAMGHSVHVKPSPTSVSLGYKALRLADATKQLAERLKLPRHLAGTATQQISLVKSPLELLCDSAPIHCPASTYLYRSIDGSCNNPTYPRWGKAGTQLERILPPEYGDGVWSPREWPGIPPARKLSDTLFLDLTLPDKLISIFTMHWGQFISHDMAHVPSFRTQNLDRIECCEKDGRHIHPSKKHPMCYPIGVSEDDQFYSEKGVQCLSLTRSIIAPRDKCTLGYAEQLNQVTHYLDASHIYGSTLEESEILREFEGGRLKVTLIDGKEFLPVMKKDEGCLGVPEEGCFVSGDARANQYGGLTAIHILFLRTHNRVARLLEVINPYWMDEKLYQEARKIVGAIVQHITYNEYLPTVLGLPLMKEYGLVPRTDGFTQTYDTHVKAAVVNEFTAAAYRFGHSLISNNVQMWGDDLHTVFSGNLPLKNTFNRPGVLIEPGAFDMLLRGMMKQPAESLDSSFASAVTKFLFQEEEKEWGLDLTSINLQRGRDHGLPGYNQMRGACGLEKADDFLELADTINPVNILKLQELYNNVDDIDLYIGGILEKPVKGGIIGPVFSCIVADQFARLKDGDRFFYELGGQPTSFTETQLDAIRKVSLASLVCDSSDKIEFVLPFAFWTASHINPWMPCGDLDHFDALPWKEDLPTDGNSLFAEQDDFDEIPGSRKLAESARLAIKQAANAFRQYPPPQPIDKGLKLLRNIHRATTKLALQKAAVVDKIKTNSEELNGAPEGFLSSLGSEVQDALGSGQQDQQGTSNLLSLAMPDGLAGGLLSGLSNKLGAFSGGTRFPEEIEVSLSRPYQRHSPDLAAQDRSLESILGTAFDGGNLFGQSMEDKLRSLTFGQSSLFGNQLHQGFPEEIDISEPDQYRQLGFLGLPDNFQQNAGFEGSLFGTGDSVANQLGAILSGRTTPLGGLSLPFHDEEVEISHGEEHRGHMQSLRRKEEKFESILPSGKLFGFGGFDNRLGAILPSAELPFGLHTNFPQEQIEISHQGDYPLPSSFFGSEASSGDQISSLLSGLISPLSGLQSLLQNRFSPQEEFEVSMPTLRHHQPHNRGRRSITPQQKIFSPPYPEDRDNYNLYCRLPSSGVEALFDEPVHHVYSRRLRRSTCRQQYPQNRGEPHHSTPYPQEGIPQDHSRPRRSRDPLHTATAAPDMSANIVPIYHGQNIPRRNFGQLSHRHRRSAEPIPEFPPSGSYHQGNELTSPNHFNLRETPHLLRNHRFLDQKPESIQKPGMFSGSIASPFSSQSPRAHQSYALDVNEIRPSDPNRSPVQEVSYVTNPTARNTMSPLAYPQEHRVTSGLLLNEHNNYDWPRPRRDAFTGMLPNAQHFHSRQQNHDWLQYGSFQEPSRPQYNDATDKGTQFLGRDHYMTGLPMPEHLKPISDQMITFPEVFDRHQRNVNYGPQVPEIDQVRQKREFFDGLGLLGAGLGLAAMPEQIEIEVTQGSPYPYNHMYGAPPYGPYGRPNRGPYGPPPPYQGYNRKHFELNDMTALLNLKNLKGPMPDIPGNAFGGHGGFLGGGQEWLGLLPAFGQSGGLGSVLSSLIGKDADLGGMLSGIGGGDLKGLLNGGAEIGKDVLSELGGLGAGGFGGLLNVGEGFGQNILSELGGSAVSALGSGLGNRFGSRILDGFFGGGYEF